MRMVGGVLPARFPALTAILDWELADTLIVWPIGSEAERPYIHYTQGTFRNSCRVYAAQAPMIGCIFGEKRV